MTAAETLASQASALRSLHRPGQPMILLNAWDVASARAIAAAGAPAVATTSGGVAAVYGYPDGEQIPPELMFDSVGRIASALEVPLTADLESGYGLDPDELVQRMLAAGAVGANIEDTDHRAGRQLMAAEAQAQRLAAIKASARAAGVEIVLNARLDVFLRRVGTPAEQLEEGVRRAKLYAEAGADCVYPIILVDETAIGRLVEAAGIPLNIYLRPGAPATARLAELGVARISVGMELHRAASKWLGEAAAALLSGDPSPVTAG